ncbi:MAG: hypothetical protein N4A71_28230 [Carboxylicivirga sp.]|jgi:hypothetical protein|nr:hypothetical protein [Carboxylicivirga sp.]
MQNKVQVKLSAKHRNEQVELPEELKIISIEVSRVKCKDVLLEVIDGQGNSKGKPLEKWLPQIKQKGIRSLRFMMNDFSTQPIEINVSWK